jgi:hypothetical protein
MRFLDFFRRKPPIPAPDPAAEAIDPEKQYSNPEYRKHWESIVWAFKSGDVNYFCWNDTIKLPIERMHAAKAVFEEVEYRLNPDLLRAALTSIYKLTVDRKRSAESSLIEIGKVAALTSEKLDIATSPAIELKLSSIYYFDERENPFGYDYQYAATKIANWMSNQDLPAFFLTSPNAKFLPGGAELRRISQDFFAMINGEANLALLLGSYLSTLGSSELLDADTARTLSLQKELEQTLRDLSLNQPTPTI